MFCLLSLTKPNGSRRHFYFSYFYLSNKIKLGVSCESSAQQRIHRKYEVLFFESLISSEKQ